MKRWNYEGKSSFIVAVAGATGLVGRNMLETLEAQNFPIERIKALASKNSEGKVIEFRGEAVLVAALDENSFEGVDFALFSCGSGPSAKFAPVAAAAGCVVIDNSKAWRMNPEVPLVVPEVNPQEAFKHQGIIANPNCSTIQMVVALKPLHDYARIKRVVVSTYQSVSGKGKAAVDELHQQTGDLLNMRSVKTEVFPHRIAFNCIPHIDEFLEDGSCKEEEKMVRETQKILDPAIKVSATTVRVPVFFGHSEAVNVEFEKLITPEKARELLAASQGIQVVDDPKNAKYPLSSDAAGQNDVFVGRIRKDPSVEHGLNLWVVADNILKGAALNAVQIAELLIGKR